MTLSLLINPHYPPQPEFNQVFFHCGRFRQHHVNQQVTTSFARRLDLARKESNCKLLMWSDLAKASALVIEEIGERVLFPGGFIQRIEDLSLHVRGKAPAFDCAGYHFIRYLL